MKNKDNILPTPDYLLYNEIHSYVEESSNEDKHNKKVIEQKLFYIVEALAIYGATIFNSKYIAMKKCPLDMRIYDVQKKRKSMTKKPIELNDNEI